MKTPYVSRQWHDLETLKEVTQGFKESTNYRSKFTSVDRISELQEIVHLTTGALEIYSIGSEDTCNRLRNELSILRGYLVGLVSEFEDSIFDLERLTTSLHVSRIEPILDTEASTADMEHCDIEMNADIYQSSELSKVDDSFDSVIGRRHPNQVVSRQAITNTGETREIFVDLLIEWQQLGYVIEWQTEGHWQTLVYAFPSEEALELLSALVEYGVKVSGGNPLLKFPQMRSKKGLDSGPVLIENNERNFHLKLGENPSLKAANASQDTMNLLETLQQRGYRIEKQASGKLLTSLSDYPDEETKLILLKLIDCGLEIWPGKGFMR
jgi:hypothetical protein